jgi:hypothetical protein
VTVFAGACPRGINLPLLASESIAQTLFAPLSMRIWLVSPVNLSECEAVDAICRVLIYTGFQVHNFLQLLPFFVTHISFAFFPVALQKVSNAMRRLWRLRSC